MEVSRSFNGDISDITFDYNDRLVDIASVSRCTSDELAELMNFLWETGWSGQPVDWSDSE